MYELILYTLGLVVASIIGYLIGKGSLPGKRSSTPPSSHAPPPTITPPPEPHFIPPQPLSALATTTSGRRRRLILVAKQLPITCTRLSNGEWSIEWEDSRSFLSNLRVLRQYMDVKWVGSPGVEVPRDEQDEFEELLGQHDCIPVFLPKDLAERFFNGFCKGVLWPLLHYVMPQSQQDFGKKWDSLWQAYTSATFLYASVVTRSVENPTDSIWIHNYHLLLLPSALRPRLPRAKIGLFIHTPFPSSDVFRLLPSRHNILSSIMCSDLIGFHTFDYARHFLSCTKRVLDLDFETMAGGLLGVKNAGRFVSILISHVGIESREFREAAQSQWVASRVEEIVSKFAGRRIIIGVDDLDLVKGSLLKLQAYERFLTNHEEWRDQVVLIEILLPSSTAQSEKKAVRESLMNEISSIRQQFGPNVIEVIERDNIDFKEMVALFNASQVAVVSTFWDGLNLTPYEYTASQSMVNPGALVVSEFMGCSRSLTGVFRVNPWGLEMVADAIHQALQLSLEERRAHHQRRFAYVMNHTIEQWGRGFLENLDRATQMSSGLTFMQVGWGSNVKLVGLRSDFRHLDEDTVTRAYRNCNQRILLLDYDGTLTPNVATRSKLVGPSPEILDCLRLLAEEPNTVVFIMSGRKRSSLGAWFKDIPELGLAAEKGCFLRWPKKLAATCRQDHGHIMSPSAAATTTPKDVMNTGEKKKKVKIDEPEEKIENYDDDDDELDPSEWETMVPDDDDSWKQTALEVLRAYTVQTDGSWIEDKEFACVWHYENADPEYGRMQASDLSKYLVKVLANPGIDVVRYDNNRILEVKPKGVNKGLAATAILEAVVNNKDPISPFILCVGDDRSDEDMFEAVQNRDDLITKPQGGVRKLKRLMHTTSNRTLKSNSTKLSFMNDENDKINENKEEEKPIEKKVDPNTFTCCVGIRPSAASYYLHDEIEVINIVHALATCSRYIQTYHSGQNSPSSAYAPLSPTSLPDPHSIPTQTSTSSSSAPTAFASLKPSSSSGNKLSSGVKASLSGGSLNLRNRRTGNLAAMAADLSDED